MAIVTVDVTVTVRVMMKVTETGSSTVHLVLSTETLIHICRVAIRHWPTLMDSCHHCRSFMVQLPPLTLFAVGAHRCFAMTSANVPRLQTPKFEYLHNLFLRRQVVL